MAKPVKKGIQNLNFDSYPAPILKDPYKTDQVHMDNFFSEIQRCNLGEDFANIIQYFYSQVSEDQRQHTSVEISDAFNRAKVPLERRVLILSAFASEIANGFEGFAKSNGCEFNIDTYQKSLFDVRLGAQNGRQISPDLKEYLSKQKDSVSKVTLETIEGKPRSTTGNRGFGRAQGGDDRSCSIS